jgi:hypothetical protein
MRLDKRVERLELERAPDDVFDVEVRPFGRAVSVNEAVLMRTELAKAGERGPVTLIEIVGVSPAGRFEGGVHG